MKSNYVNILIAIGCFGGMVLLHIYVKQPIANFGFVFLLAFGLSTTYQVISNWSVAAKAVDTELTSSEYAPRHQEERTRSVKVVMKPVAEFASELVIEKQQLVIEKQQLGNRKFLEY